jgi:hypothetical protein
MMVRSAEESGVDDERGRLADQGRWQELVHNLEGEWKRLNRELIQVREERDQLRKALAALTWKGCSLTKEEIVAQIGKEKPLREFLEELRQHLEN